MRTGLIAKKMGMPIFFAIKPVRIILSSEFDLDVDTSRKIELHQRVYGLWCRVDNVENPFVGPDFKLLTGFLVHVRRAQYSELFNPCWQRDRCQCSWPDPFANTD